MDGPHAGPDENDALETDQFLMDPKSCGILLLHGRPPKEFLLMKHADRWDLPKGHVDPGETEIECALRETEEETGISRDLIQLVPDFRYVQQYYVQSARTNHEKKLKSLIIFLAFLPEQIPVTVTEHLDYKWFPWSPPHQIQKRTIDPLLESVAAFLDGNVSQT